MTHQQILWAINDAALLAAQSALDAFGSDPAAEFPSPEMAWDFLNNNVYGEDEGEIERPATLPDFMTRQFEDDYSRHLLNLVRERSRVTG